MVGNMKKKTHVVLSGTMRSGTTLMGAILNAHSQINIVSDTLTWFFKRCYKQFGKMSSEYELDNALFELEPFMFHFHNKYSLIELREQVMKKGISYESIYHSLIELELNEKLPEFYGIKSTHAAFEYEKIILGMPNSKIIHMVRDVRDVYFSHKHFIGGKSDSFFRNIKKSLQAIKLIVARRILKREILLEERIFTPYHFEKPLKMGDYWTVSNQLTIDLMNQYPKNIIIIRYEDLIRDVEHEMKKVIRFLGAKWEPDFFKYDNLTDRAKNPWKVNTSFEGTTIGYDKSKIGQSKNKLSDKENEYLSQRCALQLKEFGYLE